MEFYVELLIAIMLVIAGFFGLVGSYGLVKLPDQMTRLHGPTKAATLGVGGVLIASLLWFGFFGPHFSWHELLIALFLFLTAPITGLMISKINLHLTWSPEELPHPVEDQNWATFGNSAERSLMDAAPDSGRVEREHHE
ncbi:Na+/H+ antiporter subunit G [Paracoccus seriniphilus]|uniref:Multisubunit potassium/proton antiporter, PhaG subunit n=1 Tax=Paracoccus seriniphilus TaxID=184748 RepID=A0A239Q2Z2_9RHOB|nr:Na+/H+ antiporter subunit G [Paracoccus seriniphilus]WCR14549.1 Na+/H+ antiporter subunit G [Paracoccus seriniphilus]SNT76583.1 multisubunit potassium/proton antiporter, PhaG subunit [Paracoccus seriniphilus]